MSETELYAEIQHAAERIRAHVRETAVEPSALLAGRCAAASVHLKCENLQRTGSFKFRGALNRLLTMPAEDRARGVVAASTGNHGLAVAQSAQILGHPALIYHPTDAQETKLAGIRRLGAETRAHGQDCVECEAAARDHAAAKGLDYVSPYNDLQVVAGQGTIAVELQRQLEGVDAVFVSVGGGGLIAGIGTWLRRWQPQARLYGCSPTHSAVMLHSLAAGELLELESLPTLSDGTAGGVEAGSLTFELCQRVVDESVFVSEEEIAAALRCVVSEHHMLIEGAAATAVAGYLKVGRELAGKRVAILLCGANIASSTLKGLL
ncbi:MAG: threonine dehydratase [Chlamydiales bacterium]|jgi:threonine dehydratase